MTDILAAAGAGSDCSHGVPVVLIVAVALMVAVAAVTVIINRLSR